MQYGEDFPSGTTSAESRESGKTLQDHNISRLTNLHPYFTVPHAHKSRRYHNSEDVITIDKMGML